MIQWVGSTTICQGLASLNAPCTGNSVSFGCRCWSSDISSNLTQWFSNFGFADFAARQRDGFWRFWQLWPNMTGLQRIWVQGMSSRQGCEKTRKWFEPTQHFGNYGIDKTTKVKERNGKHFFKKSQPLVYIYVILWPDLLTPFNLCKIWLQPQVSVLKTNTRMTWNCTRQRLWTSIGFLGFWVGADDLRRFWFEPAGRSNFGTASWRQRLRGRSRDVWRKITEDLETFLMFFPSAKAYNL